jgi:hypothetical protein
VSAHAVSLEQTRASRLRLLLARPAVAPVALGCLTLAFVALTWNTWGNPGNDTGYDTLAGIRVAHGQLPYIDFTYYYGPLAPFALGFASLIGGSGMWPAVAFGLAIAVAIVFAAYALAAALSNPLGGFLAGAMTAAVAFASNSLSFVDPHTYSATLGVLLTLLFLICVHRFAAENATQWLIGAGGALGLVCLTRFEFALAVAAASVVWLTLRVRGGLSGRRDVGLFVLPAVVIPAAVYGAFLSAVSVHDLLLENLYPRDFLQVAGNHVLHFRTPWTISSFISLGAKLALYAVGVALVLFVARLLERRHARFHRLLVVGLGFGALVILAAAIADPEALRHGLQYAYGWIPAGAALGTVLLIWRRRHGEASWSPIDQTELATAVALTVAAGFCYAAFYIDAFKPQMAVYVLPLAAPLLVRLHLCRLAPSRSATVLWVAWLAFLAAATMGLALKDASAETATVRGPGGAISARPTEAAVFRSAVAAIESRTRPGEPVLLAPQMTWMYALTERANPLPQLSLLPGVLNTPAQERQVISRLNHAGVRLAVIDVHPYVDYGHGAFGVTFDRMLARWIHRNFSRVATLVGGGADSPTLEIWSRRAP